MAPATRYFEGFWSLVKSQRDSTQENKLVLEAKGSNSQFTFLSEEKLRRAGVDNGVGGVVSRYHEVVGSAAPVSVTN